MNQKTKAAYLFAIVLSLVFGLASLAAVAKNDNAKNNNSSKDSQSQGKNKTINPDNFEKPDKAKGETNAQVHKEKTESVIANLEQVATQEESAGNTEISDQIEQVIEEQEQTQEEAIEAIEEVEKRGKLKTFLVGSDYKNLGQLRSELARNRNQIRKLIKNMEKISGEENQNTIENQIQTLMQERERIKNMVMENEGEFSLLGWLFRFVNGYKPESIDWTSETALENEVNEIVNEETGEENGTEEETEEAE